LPPCGEGSRLEVVAVTSAAAFDPLYDLAGAWTTALAERYLPLPELPRGRYECDDGRLVVAPTEASTNSYGESRLIELLAPAARRAGFLVYGPVNLTFDPGNWIEPDVTVLHRSGEGQIWVPATYCTMPVEMVSPSPRGLRRDRIDKPRKCAAAGIPFFMRVELNREIRHAAVTLLRLDQKGGDYRSVAHAIAGQTFATDEPFPISFDPTDLLEP
jgi:hypothetical protein